MNNLLEVVDFFNKENDHHIYYGDTDSIYISS